MITRKRSRAYIAAVVVLSSAILLDRVPMFVQAQSMAASEAATSIAKAKLDAATAAQNAGKKKYPVTRDDMVVAMPVDQAHLTVAHASRVWRKVLFPLCQQPLRLLLQRHCKCMHQQSSHLIPHPVVSSVVLSVTSLQSWLHQNHAAHTLFPCSVAHWCNQTCCRPLQSPWCPCRVCAHM